MGWLVFLFLMRNFVFKGNFGNGNLKVHQQKFCNLNIFPVVVRNYTFFSYPIYCCMHFKGFNIIYNLIVIDITFSTLETKKKRNFNKMIFASGKENGRE